MRTRPRSIVPWRCVETLLLISASEPGKRKHQHHNVIEAARKNGVQLIAYTSLLRADRSPLNLAEEHKATEDEIKASGIAYTILRNGWYTENYTDSIPGALAGVHRDRNAERFCDFLFRRALLDCGRGVNGDAAVTLASNGNRKRDQLADLAAGTSLFAPALLNSR